MWCGELSYDTDAAADEHGRDQSIADSYSHTYSHSHTAGRTRAPSTRRQLGIDNANR